VTGQLSRARVMKTNPPARQPRIPAMRLRLVTEPPRGSDPCEPDDSAVVERMAAGDQDALAILYDRHGGACYRLARQITANATLAEDAVQEAFIGLWRSPASYRPDRGTLRSWLLGLTHHKAVDSVRRETAQQRRQEAHAAQRALDPPPDQDPATAAWDGVRAAGVRAALTKLPEAQRHAVALAYFGGYTQPEIAELTGVPLGTVKTRTFHAMRRLRLTLAPLASRGEESQ
jgi:RNA polymerase sigma factor (sigma-70 family)